jgi:agmatine deiminase
VKTRLDTPKSLGYKMPAEWAPHDAIWLSWPHDPESFGKGLPKVEQAYASLIKEIHRTERVELFIVDPEMQKRASSLIDRAGADLSKVRFHGFPYADVWIRDYGPTFVTRKREPKIAMVHWIFNAWGGKYEELMGDTRVPDQMFPKSRFKKFSPGIVMEGGSIEVNGQGTVMTTEQCLLNKNRNPKLSRKQIEQKLKDKSRPKAAGGCPRATRTSTSETGSCWRPCSAAPKTTTPSKSSRRRCPAAGSRPSLAASGWRDWAPSTAARSSSPNPKRL